MEVREICIAHDASWSTAFDRSDQIADVTSRNNYAGHIEILGEMEWLTEKLHNYLQASQGVTDILTGTDGQAGLNNGAWDEWAQVMGALASESGFNPEDLNAEVIIARLLAQQTNTNENGSNDNNIRILNQALVALRDILTPLRQALSDNPSQYPRAATIFSNLQNEAHFNVRTISYLFRDILRGLHEQLPADIQETIAFSSLDWSLNGLSENGITSFDDQIDSAITRECSGYVALVPPPPQIEAAPPPPPPSWIEEHLPVSLGLDGGYRGSFSDQEEVRSPDSAWMAGGWAKLGLRFNNFGFNLFGRYNASFGPAATDGRILYNRYSSRYIGGGVELSIGQRWLLNLTGGWLVSGEDRYNEALEVIEERDASLGVVELGAQARVASQGEVYFSAGVTFDREYDGFFVRGGLNWLTSRWLRFDVHVLYGNSSGNRVGLGLGIDLRAARIPRTGWEFLIGTYVNGGWQQVGEANEGEVTTGLRLTLGNPFVRELLMPQGMGM